MQSRAAVFLGPGRPFEIRGYPVPDPEPGAIIVKLHLTNICGSDLHQWRGDGGSNVPPGGRILGHEMVGEVAALGQGVETDSLGQPLALGDRIVYTYFYPCRRCPACTQGRFSHCPNRLAHSKDLLGDFPYLNGGFAEYYYLRPNHFVFKVPESLPDEIVAPSNCAVAQVIHGLREANFGLGDSLVVQGAGALGIYATAVARSMGAGRIIAIDVLPQRLRLAREFGADETVCLQDYPTAEERVARVHTLTKGEGARVVLEVVGLPQVIPEGIQMLGPGATYLEIGMVSAKFSFELFPSDLLRKNARFVALNQYEPMALAQALAFLEQNRERLPFEQIVSHKYPLNEITDAFKQAEWSGRHPSESTVFRAAIAPFA